jgi:hypothetical protein
VPTNNYRWFLEWVTETGAGCRTVATEEAAVAEAKSVYEAGGHCIYYRHQRITDDGGNPEWLCLHCCLIYSRFRLLKRLQETAHCTGT